MPNRYLLDYNNPDAGIGHSLGIINKALKIAERNNLQLVYSESQLVKSSANTFKWKIKQFFRIIRGKKAYETHNLGNSLNSLLDLKKMLPSRERVEEKIRQGKIKLINLPIVNIANPSTNQNDDEVYRDIDYFIRKHPEPNLAFRISNNFAGDYEYAATRDWFLYAYSCARKDFPIALIYDSRKLNIAIHIRRGDLLPGRQFSDLSSRMLPDSWYKKILEIIIKSTSKDLSIHIFSEGVNGEYHSENGMPFSWKAQFANSPYEIHEHIDSDFMNTFHHLVNADILIGSKSGMSHLAGMLSNKIKIMPMMWHSYRGSNRLLEILDLKSDIHEEMIINHVQANL